MRLPTDRIAHIREMVRLKARPATGLAEQPDAAERVAAFVGPIWPLEGHPWEQAIARFSGGAWARREGAVIETLDRAECLGVIPSASSSEAFVPRRASHAGKPRGSGALAVNPPTPSIRPGGPPTI